MKLEHTAILAVLLLSGAPALAQIHNGTDGVSSAWPVPIRMRRARSAAALVRCMEHPVPRRAAARAPRAGRSPPRARRRLVEWATRSRRRPLARRRPVEWVIRSRRRQTAGPGNSDATAAQSLRRATRVAPKGHSSHSALTTWQLCWPHMIRAARSARSLVEPSPTPYLRFDVA